MRVLGVGRSESGARRTRVVASRGWRAGAAFIAGLFVVAGGAAAAADEFDDGLGAVEIVYGTGDVMPLLSNVQIVGTQQGFTLEFDYAFRDGDLGGPVYLGVYQGTPDTYPFANATAHAVGGGYDYGLLVRERDGLQAGPLFDNEWPPAPGHYSGTFEGTAGLGVASPRSSDLTIMLFGSPSPGCDCDGGTFFLAGATLPPYTPAGSDPSPTPDPDADVAQTADVPPVASSVLVDSVRGPVSAPASAVRGSSIAVTVGSDFVGDDVWAWLYSDPIPLGQHVVAADGTISVTIPSDTPPGAHRIAIVSATGTLIGWDDITITVGSNVVPRAATGLDEGVSGFGWLAVGGLAALFAGLALAAARTSRGGPSAA